MCEVKWKIEFTHEPKFIYYKDRKIQKYCMRKGIFLLSSLPLGEAV